MLKRMTLLCTTAMLSSLLTSCIFDADKKDVPPPPGKVYEDLTERWHVLNNLELAYEDQKIQRYDAVLDDNFTFFFFSGDVGGEIPAQWGRAEELAANTNLFDKAYVDQDPSDGVQEPCKKIKMDVQWESGLQWQKVTQGGGEEWFTTTVFYNFQFDVGENDHFINNPGSKAQFTVRNAGTEQAPHWQLVEFRDLDQDL